MSKREALARFHTWCAAGYRKAEAVELRLRDEHTTFTSD
jgi:hypothetical protein